MLKIKTFPVYFSIDFHARIKNIAETKEMTIKQYVLEAIEKELYKDEHTILGGKKINGETEKE